MPLPSAVMQASCWMAFATAQSWIPALTALAGTSKSAHMLPFTPADMVKTIEETVASATSITEGMDKQLGLKSVEQDLDDEVAF